VQGARHVPGERQEAGRRGCQAEGQEDEGRSFGKYMVRRPEHHACPHIGARAREGLSPGVPGGRSGLVSGGACLQEGRRFEVDFGKRWAILYYW